MIFWVAGLFAKINKEGFFGSDIFKLKSSPENTQAVSSVLRREIKIFRVVYKVTEDGELEKIENLKFRVEDLIYIKDYKNRKGE